MKRNIIYLIAVLIFSSQVFADTAVYIYATPRGGEIIGSIPLHYKPYRFYTAYSLRIPNLQVGDIVSVDCQFEATNNLGFNVVLAQAMMVHTYETILSGDVEWPVGEFIPPIYPAGDNVSPDRHHIFRSLSGSFVANEDGDHWISLIVYAASTAASAGDYLIFHERYGGISATVYRNDYYFTGPTAGGGTFSGEFNEDGTISGTYIYE